MSEAVVQRAKTFVDEVVKPSIRDWERTGSYPREAVAGCGLTGMFVPGDQGGLDLSYLAAADVFEELGRGDAALAFSISTRRRRSRSRIASR